MVVADAALVMSRAGGKPFFLSAANLVDVTEGDESRARSKVEQEFTLTLRRVFSNDRPRICFTVGHGEKRLDDGGPRGLGELSSRLRKNNYDPEEVDTSIPSETDPLKGCRVAVIVGPTQTFAAEDAARIRVWFEEGRISSCWRAPPPTLQITAFCPWVSKPSPKRPASPSIKTSSSRRTLRAKLPGGYGEQFLAEAKVHEITQGLVGEKNRDLKS